jgi:hypothetical protein
MRASALSSLLSTSLQGEDRSAEKRGTEEKVQRRGTRDERMNRGASRNLPPVEDSGTL